LGETGPLAKPVALGSPTQQKNEVGQLGTINI